MLARVCQCFSHNIFKASRKANNFSKANNGISVQCFTEYEIKVAIFKNFHLPDLLVYESVYTNIYVKISGHFSRKIKRMLRLNALYHSMTHETDSYSMIRIVTKELFYIVMAMCHAKKIDSFKL